MGPSIEESIAIGLGVGIGIGITSLVIDWIAEYQKARAAASRTEDTLRMAMAAAWGAAVMGLVNRSDRGADSDSWSRLLESIDRVQDIVEDLQTAENRRAGVPFCKRPPTTLTPP